VNASNRAQQRQLELWKKDPSVPIKPPPHPILNAAKYYGPLLISIYISVRYLYKDVTNPVPMARTDVLSIALEIGAIVFMMNFMFIMFVVRSFGDMLIGFLRTFPGEMKS